MTIKKRIILLSVLASVLALLAALALFMQLKAPASGQIARITQNGRVLYEIDLSAVKEPYTLRIEDEAGHYNVVEVRPGSIGMKEADCPDLLCVHMGFIRSDALPITCLPHRVVIQIVPSKSAPVSSGLAPLPEGGAYAG